MTFEKAAKKLKEDGCKTIRRVKFREREYRVPNRPDLAPIKMVEPVDGKRFGLEKGTLDAEEFWVPVGFHAYKGWMEMPCWPDWIDGSDERAEWCQKRWITPEWPNHGERSECPAKFIRDELKSLLSRNAGHPDKPAAPDDYLELKKIGAEYLAEAISLALVSEPEDCRRSKDALLKGRIFKLDADQRIMRIIELAFRAGSVAEQYSTFDREIPRVAQVGAPIAENLANGKSPIPRKKLSKFDETLVAFMDLNRRFRNPEIIRELIAKNLVEKREHPTKNHRFKSAEWMTKDGISKKLTNLRKRYLCS